MAKVIIELDLDDQEDKHKLEYLQNGWKYKGCISDILEKFRKELKYNEKLSDETYDKLSQIREEIANLIEEYKIDL